MSFPTLRAIAWAMFWVSCPCFAQSLTLLHTNDLHSHFRSDHSPLERGGLARLKTAIDAERARYPDALLVDGGDWSEGEIYYVEGAGRESLRLMDELGYDVSVVGNHDWFNGPDVLLNSIDEARPRLKLLSANLDTEKYSRKDEFEKKILPFVIRDVNGLKIALIGLSTYELIFDRYFEPVEIEEPGKIARRLAQKLKDEGADVVIAISHNTTAQNIEILKHAPDLDLIVGAHDHRVYPDPIRIERDDAAPAWIVEAGCFGRFLGEVQFDIAPRERGRNRLKLVRSRMIQIDRTIPEDPEIRSQIEALETRIEAKLGDVFEEDAGENEIDLLNEGYEAPMVDLATDAYRAATGADIALEQRRFVYGGLYRGPKTTADFLSADPAIYDFQKKKSWTVMTLPMLGKTLERFFNLIYAWKPLRTFASLTPSGLEVALKPLASPDDAMDSGQTDRTFDERYPDFPEPAPPMRDAQAIDDRSKLPVQSVRVNGRELEPNQTYTVAFSGGVLEAIQRIHSILPGILPIDGLRDSGIEGWRAIEQYFQAREPITKENTPPEGRVHAVTADVGVLQATLQFDPWSGNFSADVENFGDTPSGEGTLSAWLETNANGANFGLNPVWRRVGKALSVPELKPRERATLQWNDVDLVFDRGVYVSRLRIASTAHDTSYSRSSVIRLFSP